MIAWDGEIQSIKKTGHPDISQSYQSMLDTISASNRLNLCKVGLVALVLNEVTEAFLQPHVFDHRGAPG
jgi:hypothetical protein